jgi:SAM-dependent methyltransferase
MTREITVGNAIRFRSPLSSIRRALRKAETAHLWRKLLPPDYMRVWVGAEKNYAEIGEQFMARFERLCGLRSDATVLDLGCGCGLMAIPLAPFLKDGRYEGLDNNPPMIEWCQQNLAPKFPNFRFQLADVFSGESNTEGRLLPKDYVFPFGDGAFDFIFAKSLFTHLLPEATERYLSEVARTLRPGGSCLLTYFLKDESLNLSERRRGELSFAHSLKDCSVESADRPERAVAYELTYLKKLYERFGLEIRELINDFQDIVVATKT